MTKANTAQELSNSKVTSEQLDIWSSILNNQKNRDEASQSKTPSYIHPLVKKSESYLNEKSLEMCTESLGSETGSDWFSSSYTSSSSEDNKSEDAEKIKTCYDDDNPKNSNNYSLKNKKKPRCIPPPLPSLTSQSQQLQVRSHRNNGRLFLFLQAVVSVPSHNNFISTRQNGHLILTFANHVEEDETVIEQQSARSLELVVNNKVIGLVNKSPKLSEKFNQVTKFEDVKALQHGSLSRSLSLINGYQYYWRTKATRNFAPLVIPNDQHNIVVFGKKNIYQGSKETTQDSQELFGTHLCKYSRTTVSFLFWDPSCIAN